MGKIALDFSKQSPYIRGKHNNKDRLEDVHETKTLVEIIKEFNEINDTGMFHRIVR